MQCLLSDDENCTREKTQISFVQNIRCYRHMHVSSRKINLVIVPPTNLKSEPKIPTHFGKQHALHSVKNFLSTNKLM